MSCPGCHGDLEHVLVYGLPHRACFGRCTGDSTALLFGWATMLTAWLPDGTDIIVYEPGDGLHAWWAWLWGTYAE